MALRKGLFALVFILAASISAHAESDYSVEIDLQQQTAYLLRGRHVVMTSPLSTGRSGHLTETGSFKIIEKERNHFSSIYGKIVDANGRTVVTDADADMHVPPGGKFIPAPMRYFMRFHAATGMHAGYLPGYPASHGCVRMPEDNAIAFFNAVEVGTPVHVFGRPPRQNEYGRLGPQPSRRQQIDPRFAPRQDPRFRDPRSYDPYALPPPPGWWR
ncbi:MAG: L,D-transpeptidase [Verrucomicrobiota bacterium]|nr:L,D-transpeptidase [Verrucomicrobiota bacterium]